VEETDYRHYRLLRAPRRRVVRFRNNPVSERKVLNSTRLGLFFAAGIDLSSMSALPPFCVLSEGRMGIPGTAGRPNSGQELSIVSPEAGSGECNSLHGELITPA
jgi:hypothetical protein